MTPWTLGNIINTHTYKSERRHIEMPIRLPDKLPAIEFLKKENIFVLGDERANSQDIRPLKIAILNLMPLKITTETDLIRLLSNSPLQLEVQFMKVKAHTSKNTPIEHMKAFYHDFDRMKEEKFDGMIITGAPVEHLDYKDVNYWEEISRQDCITITVSRSIRCRRRCLASSRSILYSRSCPSSGASTMSSTCHTAGIRKYAGKT